VLRIACCRLGENRKLRIAKVSAGLVLAVGTVACAGERRGVDSARARAAVTSDSVRPATSAAPSQPVTPGSPWPRDTASKSIAHFSFEVPAQREQVPRCRAAAPLVTPDSVGPMHAGQTLAQLQRVCPKLFYGWYYTDDQAWAPAAAARLGDGVTVALLDGTAPESRVSLVVAVDSAIRTREGVGARTTLAAARAALGDPTLVPRKCAVFARWPTHPGLIARLLLADETRWECSMMRKLARSNDLRDVPSGTVIGFIGQERGVH
jgi:hypothetical protein